MPTVSLVTQRVPNIRCLIRRIISSVSVSCYGQLSGSSYIRMQSLMCYLLTIISGQCSTENKWWNDHARHYWPSFCMGRHQQQDQKSCIILTDTLLAIHCFRTNAEMQSSSVNQTSRQTKQDPVSNHWFVSRQLLMITSPECTIFCSNLNSFACPWRLSSVVELADFSIWKYDVVCVLLNALLIDVCTFVTAEYSYFTL